MATILEFVAEGVADTHTPAFGRMMPVHHMADVPFSPPSPRILHLVCLVNTLRAL